MEHEVYIDPEVETPPAVEEQIRRAVLAALEGERVDVPCIVEVCVTDDEGIRQTNLDMRGVDRPTDVLSFPMGEDGHYDVNHETGAKILGDIVLSVPKAMEQANLYGHSLEREIGYLTAHSMLHLLGYDHEDGGLARVRMREKEELVMSQLGLPASSSYTDA